MIKNSVIFSILFLFPIVCFSAEGEPAKMISPELEPIHLKPAEQSYKIDISEEFISKKNAPLGRKSGKAVKLANDWINRKVLPTSEGKDGSVVYGYGETMPIVVCKPLRVCVLQLEEGEEIIDVPRCGDTARWAISPSKPNEKRPPHIYIKPLDSGLTTNLTILTNRRTYMVALKSRNDSYTPIVSFRYPENDQKAWEAYLYDKERRNEEESYNNKLKASNLSFDAKSLDFDYIVNGDAIWKPLRVFNDGLKTYIQMPKIMKMYEAPVLLTINDGEEALVNYRLHDDLFIVDQLFEEAVLISGVGNNKTEISINHKVSKKNKDEENIYEK